MVTRCCARYWFSLVVVKILICAGSCSGQTAGPVGDQPYSLTRLLEKLLIIRKNPVILNENILKKQLMKVGISFELNPDSLQALKKAGATDEFIENLKRLVPDEQPANEPKEAKRAPAPPPKPREGTILVRCSPVDCEVVIDGRPTGRTRNGVLTAGPLPLGDISVAIRQDDYESDKNTQRVSVSDEVTNTVEFSLTPSRRALEVAGQALFDRMMAAFGGEDGLKAALSVKASGTLTFDREGSGQTKWGILAMLRLPDLAKFTGSRNGQSLECFKLETGLDCRKEPKDRKDELYEALLEFYDRQIGRTIERLRGSGLRMAATRLTYSDGENPVLRVEGGADTLVITIASDLPREIKVESRGFSDGLRMLYMDYEKIGGTSYPKTQTVLWPGTARKGLEARFDVVELGSGLFDEKELLPKKGLFRR